MTSSFRPLVPQPLHACLTVEEQQFFKKHHDRVRQNHVFINYLLLFVFGAIGMIFVYGTFTLYLESRRSASSGMQYVAFFFGIVAVVFFGVCGWYIRELKIKKEINRLVKKCSR